MTDFRNLYRYVNFAAATPTDHFKYKKKIKELAIFIREKLQERNLIKKLKYRPKEFWNFKGKKIFIILMVVKFISFGNRGSCFGSKSWCI